MSNILQLLPFYLNQALGTSETSFDVKNLKDSRGNLIIAMPSGVAKIIVTIEPQSSNNQEIISFTGITNKGNGIVTLTGVTRNLSPVSPFTALTPAVIHANNVTCIVSDSPQVFQDVVMTNEDRTVSAIVTFNASPTVPNGVNPTDVVNKSQLDAVVAGDIPASSTTVYGAVRMASEQLKTIGTATMTIASPCVVTFNSHGLISNDIIHFTTTSALPTGVTANTQYYVMATGLTANTFQISATSGGAAINTSGSQSGTHTLYRDTPYAINDQDTRLPTQGEKDAMSGKSLSPVSASNPFEDYNDTAVVATANKLLRLGSDGYIGQTVFDRTFDNTMSFTAGEALTAGDCLHILDSFAQDGYITTDVATIGSATTSITIPATSNRCLIVNVTVQGDLGTVSCSGVTHNGTGMVQIGVSGLGNNGYYHTIGCYQYKLIAPATGTHDVVVTATGLMGVSIYSFSNVDQTTPTESFGGTTTPPVSVTPSVKNCKIVNTVGMFGVWGGGITSMNFSDVATTNFLASGYFGSGISERIDTVRSESGNFSSYQTGGSSDGGQAYAQVVIRPSSATAPAVVKARVTGAKTTFVGFAKNSVSSGYQVIVKYAGVVTGLTGLTVGATYYVGDVTAGVISSTGTRKVGIALTTTTLLITNIA